MTPQSPKRQRCAIYTRKSTEHNLDLEFNSLDAQREACEAYIKSQAHEGWRLIPDHFDDGGLSGASLSRPSLQRLYFPSYSNGLKENARFLGFEWSDTTADGLQAIVWRHLWEDSSDPELREKLITYNKEDCAALGIVTRALGRLSVNPNVNEPQPLQTDVVRADAIRPTGKWRPFKSPIRLGGNQQGSSMGLPERSGFRTIEKNEAPTGAISTASVGQESTKDRLCKCTDELPQMSEGVA